jgi:imidazolonepropionase-like amidohydrolase
VKENLLALVSGKLIDGSGRNPIAESTVILEGKVIRETGRKGKVKIPEGCRVIDVAGKTVLPGLTDLHVHLSMGEQDVLVPSAGLPPTLGQSLTLIGIKGFAHARRSLDMGFTTLRDVGDVGFLSVALRDAVATGMVEGPRIFASGQFLTTTGGHADALPCWVERGDEEPNVADGREGVLKAVRRQIKMKTDWIKFFATGGIMDPWDVQEFSDEEIQTIVNEAHDKNRRVCAHCMHPKGTLAAVKAGIDTVEHGSNLTEEIIDLMLKKGTFLIPTIYAPYANVHRGPEYGLPKIYTDRCRPVFESHVRSFQTALKAGVKMALGTDCGYTPCVHGTNAFELELLVEYGMSPMNALLSGTRNAAEALGMGDKLGTLEKGKWADLIVIDGDPLKDIRVLQKKEKIVLVMKEGSIYRSSI